MSHPVCAYEKCFALLWMGSFEPGLTSPALIGSWLDLLDASAVKQVIFYMQVLNWCQFLVLKTTKILLKHSLHDTHCWSHLHDKTGNCATFWKKPKNFLRWQKASWVSSPWCRQPLCAKHVFLPSMREVGRGEDDTPVSSLGCLRWELATL